MKNVHVKVVNQQPMFLYNNPPHRRTGHVLGHEPVMNKNTIHSMMPDSRTRMQSRGPDAILINLHYKNPPQPQAFLGARVNNIACIHYKIPQTGGHFR